MGETMDFRIPKPLKTEHKELHAALVRASKIKGKVGEAARAVAALLHPHFLKEEEYALPPLGLLRPLAEGKMTPDMREVLVMTDRLGTELPAMPEEHRAVVRALRKLTAAAKAARKPDVVRFARELLLHAETEEEVLYPAAIVVGEYVQSRLPG